MSGHSKFANIKHKKEKNDAAKGKIFTRLGKELMVAVKEGGPDPNNNSKLRDVIAKAKSNNMPNDTIDRSIKKAAGDANAANFTAITYEGYGPNGTAIIVETLTDNKNRTASNVKNAFTKGNGNVGTPGCVSFMFDNKGQIIVAKEDCDKDADDLMTYEPCEEEALDIIIPKYINSLIYGALTESVASENGARMTAMDNATSNAEEMISDLALKYNRARQSSITQELTEIIAGANAIS